MDDTTTTGSTKLVDEAEALDSTELSIDISLLDVHTSVWDLDLEAMDGEELLAVIGNVARASYARGYDEGCDDEALRVIEDLFGPESTALMP